MAKKLEEYNKKRDFRKTAEPKGKPESSADDLRFVVQRHDASRLHYDFRLEFDGVLWSWAVPKGPSFDPKDKRLAVHVEDHPLDYRNFEGTIPEGEYGGGTVQLFDEGVWVPEGDPARELAGGSLKFELKGQRLTGRWTLIRMKPRDGEEDKNWLLIKEKDDHVRRDDPVTGIETSVRTGRTLAEIARAEAPTSFEDPGEADPSDPASRTKEETESKAPSSETTEAGSAGARGSLPFEEAGPMLATLTKSVPRGSDWIHELKFDGYRILAFVQDRRIRLLTRNGHDWTAKAPAVADALKKWAPADLVLDGELVVFDENGKSDFQALQSYFKNPRGKKLDYVVFDLLALGDEDLRALPLIRRKERLEDLLKDSPAGIHYSYHTEGGRQVFDQACEAAMEGIISKKKDSSYRSTRSKEWVKVKCEFRQEFVIGGYTVTDKNRTGLSALLLGHYQKDELIYTGRAGTGFSQEQTDELLKKFSALSRKTSPFKEPPRERSDETLHHLTPKLVAEIQFAEITDDGLLRQASFKGLRLDKSARDVRLENLLPNDAAKSPETSEEIDPATQREETSKSKSNTEETSTSTSKSKSKSKSKETLKSKSKSKSGETSNAKSDDPAKNNAASKSNSNSNSNSKADSKADPDAEVPEDQAKQPRRSSENSADRTDAASADRKKTGGTGGKHTYGPVRLSSPDKELFPDDGLTKGDVADYYWAIRERILPFLIRRPMTLIRCTDHIGDACFFQKHQNHPIQGMETAPIEDNDGDDTEVMILEDEEGLMGAVQMGALEFHGWGSTLDHLEQPDFLVFDLDPDEGMDDDKVRQGVRDMKTLLDDMGLDSYLKTSGGKGYHVVVPLQPAANWSTCRDFAKLTAQGMESKWPDRYTANMRKDKRKGRIYVDWVRNGRSATSVSVFSLRARRGAPISWPLRWSDLDDYAPGSVTMTNWRDHLETLDGWSDFFRTDQKLK